MKKTKRYLSILLAFALIIALLPQAAFPVYAVVDSGTCGENLSWELDISGYYFDLTITGSGAMYDWPTAEDVPWAQFQTGIRQISVVNGVTKIGDHAFENCTKLQSVTLPKSLISIGGWAFQNCSRLTTINVALSANLSVIGSYAFCGCTKLSTISMPDSLTRIGHYAFRDCTKLDLVGISAGVNQIEYDAFFGCTALQTFVVDEANPYYSSDSSGLLFDKDQSELLLCPPGITGSCTVPGGTAAIRSKAFFACTGLTGVSIPGSVESIGDGAFLECTSLADVTLSEGVSSIGAYAFSDCSSLIAAAIPASVTEIGPDAFLRCRSLDRITVDPANQHYSSDSFGVLFDKEKTTLIRCPQHFSEDYSIPNSVAVIEDNAFRDCRYLQSAAIPGSVVSIGDYAFSSCGRLTSASLILSNGLKSVGQYAFLNCTDIEEVTIPISVTDIGKGAFGFDKDYNPISTFTVRGAVGSQAQTYAVENGFNFVPVTGCAVGDHSYAYTVTKVPTQNSAGELTGICEICGAATTHVLPVLNETDYTFTVTKQPSCVETGTGLYTWNETAFGSCEFPVILNAVGHSYQAVVTPPTCTEQGYTTYTCVHGDSEFISDYTSPTGHSWDDGVVTVPPTETESGVKTYTCQSCGMTRTELVSPTGHIHSYVPAVTPPTCTAPGYTTYRCSGCGDTYTADYVAATGHSYVYTVENAPTASEVGTLKGVCSMDGAVISVSLPILNVSDYEYTVVQAASCTVTGIGCYTWKTTAYGTYSFDAILNATGHAYQGVVTAPKCTEQGYTTYTCICGDSQYVSDYTSPTGHRWDEGIVLTMPTETEYGAKVYSCRICGATRTEVLPPAGHTHNYEPVVLPPSCTSAGYTTYTCSGCGDSYIDAYVAAKGHSFAYTVETAPTVIAAGKLRGSCSVDGVTVTVVLPNLNDSDYARTVVTPASCTAAGLQRFTWRDTSCGEFSFELSILPLGHDYVQGVCNRCGIRQDNPDAPFPFIDVKESAYYFIPVRWAVNRGIASGTSANTFGPKATCTRAQVMTFLWNAAGQPEPASPDNPFTDVKPTSYYYKAVLWAVENSIATGTSPTTFGPKGTCTRAQIVTFLWNYAGAPEPATAENPFTDVKPTSYYYKAVLWAYENDVTTGTSPTTFGPKSTCTRAQVVTFLWKALT